MTDRYFGTTVNGLKEGLGLLITDDSEYCGEFKQDLKHGHGRFTSSIVNFEGMWFADRRCGIGLEEKSDGTATIAEWQNGAINGPAQVSKDNTIELAMFQNGQKTGECIISHKNLEVARGHYEKSVKEGWWQEKLDIGMFVGIYEKGVRCGFGSLSTDKSKFKGLWKDNKRNGFGIYVTPQVKYEGDFLNDKFSGIGRLVNKKSKEVVRYVGHFEGHKKAGLGKLEDSDGVYLGGFDNEVKTGLGYLRKGPDSSYLGYWSNDQQEGLGIYTSGRKILKAEWKEGRIHGLCYTIIPEKTPLFEYFQEGQYVEDADASKMKGFLKKIDDKIPNKFIDFATSKISKLEAELNLQCRNLNQEEPSFEFKGLIHSFETIKTRLSNGLVKGKKDRETLYTVLQKNGVDFKTYPGYSWDISKVASPNQAKGKSQQKTDYNKAPVTREKHQLADSDAKRKFKKSNQKSKDYSPEKPSEDLIKTKEFKEDIDNVPVVSQKARLVYQTSEEFDFLEWQESQEKAKEKSKDKSKHGVKGTSSDENYKQNQAGKNLESIPELNSPEKVPKTFELQKSTFVTFEGNQRNSTKENYESEKLVEPKPVQKPICKNQYTQTSPVIKAPTADKSTMDAEPEEVVFKRIEQARQSQVMSKLTPSLVSSTQILGISKSNPSPETESPKTNEDEQTCKEEQLTVLIEVQVLEPIMISGVVKDVTPSRKTELRTSALSETFENKARTTEIQRTEPQDISQEFKKKETKLEASAVENYDDVIVKLKSREFGALDDEDDRKNTKTFKLSKPIAFEPYKILRQKKESERQMGLSLLAHAFKY